MWGKNTRSAKNQTQNAAAMKGCTKPQAKKSGVFSVRKKLYHGHGALKKDQDQSVAKCKRQQQYGCTHRRGVLGKETSMTPTTEQEIGVV